MLKNNSNDDKLSPVSSETEINQIWGGNVTKSGLYTFSALVVAGLVTFSSPGFAAEESEFLDVKNLSAGNFLNLREEPVLTAQKVGTVPANTTGVRNLGCQVGMPLKDWRKATSKVRVVEMKRRWCKVEYEGQTGWAAGDFLSE